ncbi:MAG: FkbM family methyltransferase [Candidatus Hodarchaeota archaeon]
MRHYIEDNNELFRLLEESVLFSKSTRIEKLKKKPAKLIYSKILEKITRLGKIAIKIRAKTFWDQDMIVAIPGRASLRLYRYGFFEEGLTRMILEYLKPGMTFFDIGAHFGYYTLLSSEIVGNLGRIHSFEPTPSTLNTLRDNVSNNDNIIINNYAVFSKEKNVFINDYGTKYSAFNSIYDARLPKDVHEKLKVIKYEVESISIDRYVKNNAIIPDFIKIDAESSEYEILLGMEKTINNFSPIITIEVGDKGVNGVPRSKDIINFLIDRGYQPYEFKEGKIVHHIVKNEPYQYENIIFLSNK